MNANRSLLIARIRHLLLLVLSITLMMVPSATQAAVNKIYYTTNDDWSVKRANTDGTNVETLYTSATGTPSGIIIDPDNNKIYFTDNHSTVAKIQRMNLDGTGLEDVLTGVQAVQIGTEPPVPTAIIVNHFSARNRASIAIWLPTLTIVFGLSGLSWRKAMRKKDKSKSRPTSIATDAAVRPTGGTGCTLAGIFTRRCLRRTRGAAECDRWTGSG